MTETQTYNDGLVKIHSVTNGAAPGNAPVDALSATPKFTLCFDERVVGVTRFYSAMQNKVKIDRLIRCPRQETVSTADKAIVNGGDQYHIRQIQYPPDVVPPSMDLSLERVVHPLGYSGI